MIVRKLRLNKGWSQEQLATLCNLSVRTIQRIERGQKPSLETLNALAAVFEIEVADLTGETARPGEAQISLEEEEAILYVRDLKGFYSHLIKYAVVITFLFILNMLKSPDHLWVIWPALGWGVGILFHGLNVFKVFNFLGTDWEKRQIEKRLNK